VSGRLATSTVIPMHNRNGIWLCPSGRRVPYLSPSKYPSCSSLSACAAIYRHTISALFDWKSHGAINTKSLSRIHILRLIFPRIRQVLTLPSVHLTMILSPPTSLITRPSNSPCCGLTNSLRWDSLNTFLLPKLKTPQFIVSTKLKIYMLLRDILVGFLRLVNGASAICGLKNFFGFEYL